MTSAVSSLYNMQKLACGVWGKPLIRENAEHRLLHFAEAPVLNVSEQPAYFSFHCVNALNGSFHSSGKLQWQSRVSSGTWERTCWKYLLRGFWFTVSFQVRKLTQLAKSVVFLVYQRDWRNLKLKFCWNLLDKRTHEYVHTKPLLQYTWDDLF